MGDETFEHMLTGGHPNSLGRTVEVVEIIESDPARMAELFACYGSPDEVVRLRTSNALKRLWRADPDRFEPWIDRMLSDAAAVPQDSARWTVAQMCQELWPRFTPDQQQTAIAVLRRNLESTRDWIVVIHSMRALCLPALDDVALRDWLRPWAETCSGDPRKSVSKAAREILAELDTRA